MYDIILSEFPSGILDLIKNPRVTDINRLLRQFIFFGNKEIYLYIHVLAMIWKINCLIPVLKTRANANIYILFIITVEQWTGVLFLGMCVRLFNSHSSCSRTMGSKKTRVVIQYGETRGNSLFVFAFVLVSLYRIFFSL